MKQIQLGALSLHFSGYDGTETDVPELGERLRVRGQTGWHLVIEVHEAQRECSVVSAVCPEGGMTQVPWSDLQRVTCFEAFSLKLMETE